MEEKEKITNNNEKLGDENTTPKKETGGRSTRKASTKKKSSTETPEESNPKEMSVSEYFDYVKGMKKETDSEHVKKMCDVCADLLKKFEMLGQVEAAKKAKNAFDVLKKDLELYEKGIKTYVHIDDVTKYLKTITDHSVKLIELENYPREIPDDVVEKWIAVKDCFDAAFIVFTDYTEQTEEKDTTAAAQGKTSTAKEVEKKRKDKDPILFGVVRVNSSNTSLRNNTYEKMYFVADWIDEYCDLTFDKLVEKMASELKSDPVHQIKPVLTKEDFKKEAGL